MNPSSQPTRTLCPGCMHTIGRHKRNGGCRSCDCIQSSAPPWITVPAPNQPTSGGELDQPKAPGLPGEDGLKPTSNIYILTDARLEQQLIADMQGAKAGGHIETLATDTLALIATQKHEYAIEVLKKLIQMEHCHDCQMDALKNHCYTCEVIDQAIAAEEKMINEQSK